MKKLSKRARIALTLLGIPTFFLLLIYVMVAVTVLLCVIFNWDIPEYEFLDSVVFVIIEAVFFVTWTIYFLWAIFTRQYTWKEKLVWILVIFLMNVIGMPYFFVVMLRKYKGIKWSASARLVDAGEKYLVGLGSSRVRLSEEQWDIVVDYIRQRRMAKWKLLIHVCVLAIVVLVVVFGYNVIFEIMVELVPTTYLTKDSTGSVDVLQPEPEDVRLYFHVVLMLSFQISFLSVCALLTLVESVVNLFTSRRNMLLEAFIPREVSTEKVQNNNMPD
jgi:hypothetical protein